MTEKKNYHQFRPKAYETLVRQQHCEQLEKEKLVKCKQI